MESSSISTSEAARILGVSRQGVRYLVTQGTLHPMAKMPFSRGQYVFDVAVVEALAEKRRA
ncbi:helix-turn-helix domain-containing protein [Humidisolicoccus flavus]|uniref:helix-turn-helix domain-containing protein n=1 Tax=Humidisolicoccus flavus TaxID=3111414 RepID=UPI003D2FC823